MTDHGVVTIVDGLRDLELQAAAPDAAAAYDRPIGIRLLHQDPASGEEHHLVRYPPGTRGHVHRHTVAHTFIVLEGALDANGVVVGPGGYAHFAAGEPMRHQAGGDEGCLFVAIFHGPADVEIVAGPGD